MKIYQVSTLSALSLGYTKSVITVEELLHRGDTGLGTFEDVNGEMIVVDGVCYQAHEDGSVTTAKKGTGVPFAAVGKVTDNRIINFGEIHSINDLKTRLDLSIEEDFGLNGIHIARIDGFFEKVSARSEVPYRSQHVELKDILSKTQTAFEFEKINGSLVCLYYPDYMVGINAAGWHLHFLSEDGTQGGHVFEIDMSYGTCRLQKMDSIEIQLPKDPSFDTYSLKAASQEDIKKVEQG